MNTDYINTENFWENQAKNNDDFSGFVVKDNEIGKYRFEHEKVYLENFLKKYFPGKKDLNILDVGCARGHFVQLFSKYGAGVGFDFSESYASFCKEKFKNDKNIEIFQGNILNFKYDKKFDFIFLGGVLPYVKGIDLDIALENISSLLADGGVVIFREATMSNYSVITLEGNGDNKMQCFRRTVDYYVQRFQDHNFRIEEITQNYASTYTSVLERYRKIFRLKPSFFTNKIIEYVFLYIPVKIFSYFRKNVYTYNFIIVKKN